MERKDLENLARRRAAAKLGFIVHASAFILVNAALYAINLQLAPQHAWSFWPLGGWGIGLAIHALVVYGFAAGGIIATRLLAAELRKLG